MLLPALEQLVFDRLFSSAQHYYKLPILHDDDPGDFHFHIRMAMHILLSRRVRKKKAEA